MIFSNSLLLLLLVIVFICYSTKSSCHAIKIPIGRGGIIFSLISAASNDNNKNEKKISKKKERKSKKVNLSKSKSKSIDDLLPSDTDRSIPSEGQIINSKTSKIKVVKLLDSEKDIPKIDRSATREIMLQLGSSLLYMVASRFIFKLDFNDVQTVLICRAIFCAYLLLSQLLYWYLSQRVNKLNDTTLLPDSSSAAGPQLGDMLKGLNSNGNGDGNGNSAGGMGGMLGSILGMSSNKQSSSEKKEKKNELTVKKYDILEIKKLSNGLIFEILSVTYMHFVSKAGKPLLFVPLMGVMNKMKSPIVQLHLLRFPATGALERPFRSGLEKMMSDAVAKQQPLSESSVVVEEAKEEEGEDKETENEVVESVEEDVIVLDENNDENSRNSNSNTKVVTKKTKKNIVKDESNNEDDTVTAKSEVHEEIQHTIVEADIETYVVDTPSPSSSSLLSPSEEKTKDGEAGSVELSSAELEANAAIEASKAIAEQVGSDSDVDIDVDVDVDIEEVDVKIGVNVEKEIEQL